MNKNSSVILLLSVLIHLMIFHQSLVSLSSSIHHILVIGVESRLGAAFEYNVILRGAQGVSFPTVVAGGSNSQYVQYSLNDSVINPGDVALTVSVLMNRMFLLIVVFLLIIIRVICQEFYLLVNRRTKLILILS